MTGKNGGAETWQAYYEKTGARPPRETLLFALQKFDDEGGRDEAGLAIDLGCGNGRDTIELLRRGWPVLAVDAEADAIQGLKARPDLPPDCRLDTMVSRFETARLPQAVLINSSFALPLVPAPAFPDLWDGMVEALRPGGRIACQLYGDRDGWVGDPTITFFTLGGVEALLNPLDVEHFREEEDDGVTPRGTHKHWHIFHLVARKP